MLADHYGAYDIRNALASYIAKARDPSLSATRLQVAAAEVLLPLQTVQVYHKATFSNPDPYIRSHDAPDLIDIVYARPARRGKRGADIPARFDTVLVDMGKGGNLGLKGASNFMLPAET